MRRLTVGDLIVDRDARTVMRQDEALDLKGLTYDLLDALIEAGGEPMSLQALADTVWRGEPVSNEVITQRVRLLRRALSDDPNAPRYVETRRNTGYRICARMIELSPETAVDTRTRRGGLHWVAVVILAGVFVAGLLARGRIEPAADPLIERARTYAATGQEDDNRRAIDLFEQKLDEVPDSYGATLGLSYAYAQRVCRHDDDLAYAHRAKALAESLLARRADDTEAISALAYANDCLGQIDRALAGYLKAYRMDPQQLDARASAAHLLQIKGRLAEALEYSLDVEALTGDRPFRYIDIQIARCLELMGFRRAADARYARTVRLFPDNLFAAAAYVNFLLADGRPDEAQAVVQRASELGAATAALRSLEAELALERGDREAALAAARAAT
ncbi:MAG: winged helix-turn-helix domain-containing protein, partial [Pseudomonadota bacterium]